MRKLKREISSYTFFGILTTILSILSYKIFLMFDIYYIVATILSNIIAISFAYLTNRKYVFKSDNNIVNESIKFFISRFLVFLIETIFLIIAISFLDFDEFYSKIIVNIFVIICNYILSKFIVFKKKEVYFEKN